MTREQTDGSAAGNDVRAMFAAIAPRYDLLNHLLSLNIDKGWRRRVRLELADILGDPTATVLDVACGTGDLSLELEHDSRARVIGTDFCRPMLAIAREKTVDAGAQLPYIEADAMTLPFADDSFEGLTIAFGLRNLPDHQAGLAELLRVLKPGGRLVVLECSEPGVPGFRTLYKLYFDRIVPRIGGLVSGSRSAYTYLPDSVSKFPDKKTLAAMMERAGFVDVRFKGLTGGVAALHSGTKKL